MSRSFFLSLIALSLIMTFPLWVILSFKWPISTDLIFYATSLKSFSSQFWEGDLYPRWLMSTNAGFGSPVFVFYSPLSFYIMSMFEFLSSVDPHGFGRILIGLMLSVIIAGVTSYRWLASQTDVATAQKGALIYAGFPYIFLHMYSSFAVPQLWGLALFPLLLEAADDVVKKGWKSLPKLSLAYGLLSFTHLPSIVMFAPVPCLYVLVFSPKGKRLLLGLLTSFFAGLGITLTAVCILPAMLNQGSIVTEMFLTGNLNYANNFLDKWSQLGLVAVILPLLLLYIETPKALRKSTLTPHMYFWIAVEVVFLFMTLPFSKPLWDMIPALQHLQFPFRFFYTMIPGAVFIALHFLPNAKTKNIYPSLFVISLVCASVYSSEVAFFIRPSPTFTILKNNLLTRPEYQTRWMQKENIDFRTQVPERFLAMKSANVVEGKGSAYIIEQDSRRIMLHADITSMEATVTLQRFYFTGWEAQPNNLSVSHHDALLSLYLPRGSHDITLVLPWFSGEREGMIISIGAFITLWILYTFSRLQATHKRRIT